MKAEHPTRGTLEISIESSETTLWAEEREVYYYTNFDLFDCESAEE